MPFFISNNSLCFEVCSEINMATPAFFTLVLAIVYFPPSIYFQSICAYVFKVGRDTYFTKT